MKSRTLRKLTIAVATVLLLAVVTSPVTTIWLIKRQASEIVSDSLRGLTTSSLATMNVSEGFFLTELAVHDDKADGQTLISRIEKSSKAVDAEYRSPPGNPEKRFRKGGLRSHDRDPGTSIANHVERRSIFSSRGKPPTPSELFEADMR